MPILLRVLLLAMILLGPSATAVQAYDCHASFLGCGPGGRPHPKQLVRQCRGVCRTFRDRCHTAFNNGKMRTRCYRDLIATCLTAGGTCASACDAANPCPAGKQCVQGQCILHPPDRCQGAVCPAGYPNCGPDGRCWTQPCAELCGSSCCGGSHPVCGSDSLCHPPDSCGDRTCPVDYPHCGPDGKCWNGPCANVCGTDNCCGGDHPVCKSDGLCYRDPTSDGGSGVPANLPPGNYTVTMCVSGYVSLPCQPVGTIPFEGRTQFQTALNTAINQWLAATAGIPDCTRGATTYSAFDGSSFTVTFAVTCTSPAGSVSETVHITVHRN
ncbi:MAG: hypothetical protein E6J79_16620 [Deltaproteobacteria bacterium]|nr:MAG: hypothetical protein E6J79_16620 [Deltaproteobacteria bacterium]